MRSEDGAESSEYLVTKKSFHVGTSIHFSFFFETTEGSQFQPEPEQPTEPNFSTGPGGLTSTLLFRHHEGLGRPSLPSLLGAQGKHEHGWGWSE
jgi:hypothetical protein